MSTENKATPIPEEKLSGVTGGGTGDTRLIRCPKCNSANVTKREDPTEASNRLPAYTCGDCDCIWQP